MIVSQPVLFRACREVLDGALVPMHYKKLRDLAVARLRLVRLSALDLSRLAEDVREQGAEKGKGGMVYVGNPYCLVGKRAWFDRNPVLFSADEYRIDGDAESGIEGGVEYVMRSPYMLNKWHTKSPVERATVGIRGLVIEKHVARFFARRWPAAYKSADNAGQWNRPCNHDFRLRLGERWYAVDAAGQQRTAIMAEVRKSIRAISTCFLASMVETWS